MLKMVDKEYIRKKHFVEGWSIRKISRQLQIARQTVRKMLKDAEIPRYNLQTPRPFPLMDPYREIIQHWLEEDEKAPVKQRHTGTKIYERLKKEYDFTGGASTVRRFVRILKNTTPECFIPLEAAPGEQVQVDFGHAFVKINGQLAKAYLFCMRLKFSSVPFVIAYPTERLEAFLEGHVQGLNYFGGVPKEGLYDNAKTQVVRILEGPQREEHQWFSSLRAHYLFDSSFCRPGRGNEKGAVENLVKYVRSNALVPVPDIESWEELNEHLLKWCQAEQEKHKEKWLVEQKTLSLLPKTTFSCAMPKSVKVSSYSLVTVDRNRYSVPCKYVGQTLMAKAYVDRVEVIDKTQIVSSFPRCYQRGDLFLKLEHYLPALEKKPHAVTHATVVRKLPLVFQQLRERMVKAHSKGYKDFLNVLLLVRHYPLTAVAHALEKLGVDHIDASIVRQYLAGSVEPKEFNDQTIQGATTVEDTRCYDLLIGVSQ